MPEAEGQRVGLEALRAQLLRDVERHERAAHLHRAAAQLQTRFGRHEEAETALHFARMSELLCQKNREWLDDLRDGQPAVMGEDDDTRTECQRLRAEAAALREQVRNLSIALETNRKIGAAIGILMALHQITYDAGFECLRMVSQQAHRKLHDVADEVLLTGALPEIPGPTP